MTLVFTICKQMMRGIPARRNKVVDSLNLLFIARLESAEMVDSPRACCDAAECERDDDGFRGAGVWPAISWQRLRCDVMSYLEWLIHSVPP